MIQAPGSGAWRRGERLRSKDWGPMFESCRGCDTADLFHFEAYNEGPPWGARMHIIYKDLKEIVLGLGTHAAAFLFLSESAVFVLRAWGNRDISSTLGFRKGMGTRLH